MNSVSLQNNSNSQEKQLFSSEFDGMFNISTNASPIKNKPVKILFVEDNLSTDTGILLLKEVENNINLIDKIVAVTDYKRHESYVKHDLKTFQHNYKKKFRLYWTHSFSYHPEIYIIAIDNDLQVFCLCGFPQNHFNKLINKGLINVDIKKRKSIFDITMLYIQTVMMKYDAEETIIRNSLKITKSNNDYVYYTIQTQSDKKDITINYSFKLTKEGVLLLERK